MTFQNNLQNCGSIDPLSEGHQFFQLTAVNNRDNKDL